MDTLRQGLHRLRAGFVLPMSLVVTFITMLFVGASATYCTTQLRTSQQYMSRTRCRLVAQSAIEMTKLALMEKCGVSELTAINLGGLTVANIDGVLPSVLSETRNAEFLRKIPGVGTDMTVTVDIKPGTGSQAGIYYILATAEHKQAGRTTTVTLREGIKVPLSSSNIFDYAYFSNSDGHLASQYMVINGDVRANRDFYITGAEINGYVYASNTVHFATSKNRWDWRDDEDPCIRSMNSYNSTYRKNSQKEFSTYAKARPTNPLSSRGKQEWVGGFEAPDPVSKTTTATIGWGRWKKSYEMTTTVDTPDLDSDTLTPSKTVSQPKEDHIVNALAIHDEGNKTRKINRSPGYLKIPQIDWSDSGAYGLQYYKNRAASCSTVKGKTGGSLICSNCFINADGQVEQLSAKVIMSWTETQTSKGGWIKYETDETEETPVTDASKIANNDNLIPNASTPIYRVITSSRYNSLSTTEQEKYLQLVWDHGEAPAMGTISGGLVKDSNSAGAGKVVLKDESLASGESWMIDEASLDRLVRDYRTQQSASSSISVSDDEVNFAIDGWNSHSCAKEYSTKENKKWVSTSWNSPGATWDRTRGWGHWDTSYTYTYTGHYYSKLPVGYIQMNVSTREVDGAPILTPSYVDLNWTAPTTRKLIAVRSVALHTFYDTKSGSGRIKIDKDNLAGYSNNGTGSSFN